MPKILQFRRGTTGELEAITGAPGELFVDTTKDVVVVSDGVTAGGFPLQSELESGTNIKTINGNSILGSGDIVIAGGDYGNANVAANLAAFGSNPITTTGNITASYFFGNGSQLTGITATATPGGNSGAIQYNSGGTTGGSDVFTFNGTDVFLTGNLYAPVITAFTQLSLNPNDGNVVIEGTNGDTRVEIKRGNGNGGNATISMTGPDGRIFLNNGSNPSFGINLTGQNATISTTGPLKVGGFTGELLAGLPGQVLTSNGDGNAMSWTDAGGGNVDLSDISEDVLPMFSEVYDIGSADKRWYDGYYSNKVDINGAEILGSEDGVVIPNAALIDQLLISDNMITPDADPVYEGQKGTLIVNGNLDVDGDWLGLPTVGSSITEPYTETQNDVFIRFIADTPPIWDIAFAANDPGLPARDAFLAQLQRSGLQYFELDDGFGNIYRFTFTGPPQASESTNYSNGVQFAQSSGTWNSTPPFMNFITFNITFVGQETVIVPPTSTGSEGFLRYNKFNQSVEAYTTEWIDISGGGGAIEAVGSCSLSSTGYGAGTFGSNNNFFGRSAGQYNTTGCNNNFFGRYAGRNNTSGTDNVFIGSQAGFNNTSGSYNNVVGSYAGLFNSTGRYNNFFGARAGLNNTTGSSNNFFGNYAGRTNTTGGSNNFFGHFAGRTNSTGCSNNFFGRYAGTNNTSGCHNLFMGTQSGFNNTSGCNNLFFGRDAGRTNSTGSYNTFFGAYTGSCTTGSYNTFFGHNAGRCSSTGINNILIGRNAGTNVFSPTGLASITTESNRIIMGNSSHICAQIQIAWTTVSDARDKCIYGSINRGLGFLKNVNPIEFAFKDRTTGELKDPEGKRRYGFSAQDILALEGDQPVIVSTENPDQLQMTNDYLIPILVNAVKELSAQVDELKSRLDQLTP